MPGKVIRLLVAVADSVEAGQGLLVVEAMKMQNEIKSPKNGRSGTPAGERKAERECGGCSRLGRVIESIRKVRKLEYSFFST